MNYTELVTAIENTVENTFDKVDVDRFIQLTEELVYNTVQLPTLRKNVTGSTTANNKYLSIPSDYIATFSVAVVDTDGSYNYLLDKDVNFIRECYQKATDTGIPYCYSNFNADAFILGPTPDKAYPVELHYFYYPESIVTANTSWLGDNFEAVLVNGSVLEAARFMKAEQDIVALYTNMFSQSMQLLKTLGDGKLRRDAYRSGQVRDAVN